MFNISIAKSGSILSVDWNAMPENAQRHIIEYGLKQKLNDAGASITKDEEPDEVKRLEQKLSVAETVLSALMRGDVTVRQARSGETLEQRKFILELSRTFKKLFKRGIDENENALALLAAKLGRTEQEIHAALEKKAALAAELHRKTLALKSENPEIDILSIL